MQAISTLRLNAVHPRPAVQYNASNVSFADGCGHSGCDHNHGNSPQKQKKVPEPGLNLTVWQKTRVYSAEIFRWTAELFTNIRTLWAGLKNAEIYDTWRAAHAKWLKVDHA